MGSCDEVCQLMHGMCEFVCCVFRSVSRSTVNGTDQENHETDGCARPR